MGLSGTFVTFGVYEYERINQFSFNGQQVVYPGIESTGKRLFQGKRNYKIRGLQDGHKDGFHAVIIYYSLYSYGE